METKFPNRAAEASQPRGKKVDDEVSTTKSSPTIMAEGWTLPADLWESLLPRLQARSTQKPPAQVTHAELWGDEDPQARLQRKKCRCEEQLAALEDQISRAMSRLDIDFQSGKAEDRAAVIQALSQHQAMDPGLQRSLRRYAGILHRLEHDCQRARSPKEREEVRAKIHKVADRAAKKAKDKGAHLDLLTEVERQRGACGPDSLTGLLFQWSRSWEYYNSLTSTIASEQFGKDLQREGQERARRVRDEILNEARREKDETSRELQERVRTASLKKI